MTSGARKVSILGSTGSIGRSTLDVVARLDGSVEVAALATRSNYGSIVEQAERFKPAFISVSEEEAASRAREMLKGSGIEVLDGADGILEAASTEKADVVVSAIVGAAGVMPTFAAVEAGRTVALANKEALVTAGELIIKEARRKGSDIIPVDSEHSAVFQSLLGQDRHAVRRVILTASGGPFFGMGPEILSKVTPEMALNHPRWDMGPKVSVDSATMMNKGLEIIEARWIFGMPPDGIAVVIHPQSIVHSMVEYIDGSVLAQMSVADMRVPIAFALSYPDRMELGLDPLDLTAMGGLDFHAPDLEMFPCLGLAYEALEKGGGMPAVLNAANEAAVESFLSGDLDFKGIAKVVRSVMDDPPVFDHRTLPGIIRGDKLAREAALKFVSMEKEVI